MPPTGRLGGVQRIYVRDVLQLLELLRDHPEMVPDGVSHHHHSTYRDELQIQLARLLPGPFGGPEPYVTAIVSADGTHIWETSLGPEGPQTRERRRGQPTNVEAVTVRAQYARLLPQLREVRESLRQAPLARSAFPEEAHAQLSQLAARTLSAGVGAWVRLLGTAAREEGTSVLIWTPTARPIEYPSWREFAVGQFTPSDFAKHLLGAVHRRSAARIAALLRPDDRA